PQACRQRRRQPVPDAVEPHTFSAGPRCPRPRSAPPGESPQVPSRPGTRTHGESRATHHPSRPTEPGVLTVVAAPRGAGPLAGRADRGRAVPGGGGPRPLVRGATGGRRVRQGTVPQ